MMMRAWLLPFCAPSRCHPGRPEASIRDPFCRSFARGGMDPGSSLRSAGMTACTSLALVLVGVVGTARAQSVEDFYKGKTVSLIIGYSVGGGYDLYGRLVARHIGRHI